MLSETEGADMVGGDHDEVLDGLLEASRPEVEELPAERLALLVAAARQRAGGKTPGGHGRRVAAGGLAVLLALGLGAGVSAYASPDARPETEAVRPPVTAEDDAPVPAEDDPTVELSREEEAALCSEWMIPAQGVASAIYLADSDREAVGGVVVASADELEAAMTGMVFADDAAVAVPGSWVVLDCEGVTP